MDAEKALRETEAVLVGVDVMAKSIIAAERSRYTMKPIDENTPRDREIILGFAEYGTMWQGRWVDGDWSPKCRPDNAAPETTWEHPTHWCDLPVFAPSPPSQEGTT